MTKEKDNCGTPSGYQKHRRRNQDPCEPCILSYKEYQREKHLNSDGLKICECGGSKSIGAKTCMPCRDAKRIVPGGTKHQDAYGYIRIKAAHHPTAVRGWMREHTLVMEQFLDRPLFPNEQVHHVNGVKSDNELGNLELWVKSQPSGQRVRDIVDWAWEIIERYDKEVEEKGL